MKNVFRKWFLYVVLLLWSIQGAKAQVLTETFSIVPEYSGMMLQDIQNKAGKVVMTAQFNSMVSGSVNVWVAVDIEGDNGVHIYRTAEYKPSVPIVLQSFVMKTFSFMEIKDFFDFNKFRYDGITKEQVLASGLPSGSYKICAQILDYGTDAPLNPAVGCAFVNVGEADPPMVTKPMCADSVEILHPDMVLFTWSPAVGVAPQNVRYSLRITEVLPVGRNPLEAMASATYPYFFEVKDLVSPNFVYNASHPPMKEGRTYAFTVTANDISGSTTFKNGGASEVCWFVYGKTKTVNNTPPPAETAVKIPTTVKSKLNYFYKGFESESWPLKNTDVLLRVSYQKINQAQHGVGQFVSGSGAYAIIGAAQSTSVLFNQTQSSPGIQNPSNIVVHGAQNNATQMVNLSDIAFLSGGFSPGFSPQFMATTNANGEFEFDLNLLQGDSSNAYIKNTSTGEVFKKVYTLEVLSPYYYSAEIQFALDPGQVKELGAVNVKVKSYDLNVNVQQIYQGIKGKCLEEIEVFVLRKNKSSKLPEKEGMIGKALPSIPGYSTVAYAVTTKHAATNTSLENGVDFTRLVKSASTSDNYILYARVKPKNQSVNTIVYMQNFPSETASGPVSYGVQLNAVMALSLSNVYKKTIYFVHSDPPMSKVSGTLLYGFPDGENKSNKPLKNTKVSLVVQYVFEGTFEGVDNQKVDLSSFTIHSNWSGGDIIPADNGKILQTVYTNANGEFNFNCYHLDSCKVTNANASHGGTEFSHKYSGKIRRTLRLVVQSPYYASPDEDIIVQPWNNGQVGTLVAKVQSYNLRIHVIASKSCKDQYGKNINSLADGSLGGVKVSLYRFTRPDGVPSNEAQGMNKPSTLLGVQSVLVAEGVTDQQGFVTFKDLVRSNHTGDYYIARANSYKTDGNLNYADGFLFYVSPDPVLRTNQAVLNIFTSAITYNNQVYGDPSKVAQRYSQRDYDAVVEMMPSAPRIAGRIISKAAPTGVKSAWVELKEVYQDPNYKQYKFDVSDTNGYFEFANLKLDYQAEGDPQSTVIGPDRNLTIYAAGYVTYTTGIPVLKNGTQVYFKDIALEPKGKGLYGIVRDSMPNSNNSDLKGDEVAARVKIGDGPFVNTYEAYPSYSMVEQQRFDYEAPTGNRTITIVPFDPAYRTYTGNVSVSENNKYLGAFELTKLKHRVKFQVIRESNGQPVQGAWIVFNDLLRSTDYQGACSFEFTNNSTTNFSVKVHPSTSANFETTVVSFTNVESANYQLITIKVREAVQVKGRVVNAQNQPIVGAKVMVVNSNVMDPTFAITDQNGNYVLLGLPNQPNVQKIRATFSGLSNGFSYIGQTKTINTSSGSVIANVNFTLSVYEKMDLTKILGIPVEIDSLRELSNGQVEVSGAFVNIPENGNFKMRNPQHRLAFHQMRLIPGSEKNAANIPYGVPNVNAFGLDVASIPIKIFNVYNGEVRPVSSVIHLEKDQVSGKGKITGMVRIVDNSFNFPSSYMTFTNQDFYLGNYGQQSINTKNKLVVFKSNDQNYAAQRFSLSRFDAKPIQFTLLGFKGAANVFGSDESYISGDTIALYLKLNASIPKDPVLNLEIDAGKVLLFHDHMNPIDNNNEVKFKIEQWNVVGNGWKLATNSGGLIIKSGNIQTGIVDVPFTELVITPSDLICNNFKIDNMTVGGVVPFQVNSAIPNANKVFTHDPKVGEDQRGHYILLVTPNPGQPVGTFGGGQLMEGMTTWDNYKVGVLKLISNGEANFSFINNHPAVTLHDVVKFSPLTLSAYNGYLSMLGNVDLQIPRTPANLQGVIEFTKSPGKAKLHVKPISFVIQGEGNVKFASGANQTLDANGFTTDGSIFETEMDGVTKIFEFKGKLNRPKVKSNTRIDVFPSGQQLIYSPTSRLKDVYGSMVLKNNDWDYFRFGGTVAGAPGIGETNPQKMDFVVYGDIKAENQSIGVSGIDLPGGISGIELLYDYGESRLVGSLSMNMTFSSIGVKATANIVMDKGGWYFLLGGSLSTPGIGTVNAGMMIGDYNSFPSLLQSSLLQYAYNKNIPCDFYNGVHGFFFTGMKTSPLTLPNLDFSIGVLSVHFGVEYGLDARVYMNFHGGSPVFGIGAMAFAHAYLTLESYACTTISAETSAELLLQADYNAKTGKFSGAACTSIMLGGSIEQCFPAFGLCEGCVGIGVSKSLHILLTMDNDGFKDFSIGSGTCSNPSTNPCK